MQQEEGVSPVIATILIVAITVVLAATLYILISGNLLSTPYSSSKLVGSLTENPKTSYDDSVNFTLSMSIPEKTAKSNVKISVMKGDTVAHLTYDSGNDLWTNATGGGKWHYEAKLIDGDGDGKFSDGDTLWVYVVDDNPSDGIIPPSFHTGDKVVFSIIGYHGISSGGEIQL